MDGASWAGSPDPAPTAKMGNPTLISNGKPTTVKVMGIETLLLVAGLGQEHRLGRWLTVKGDGAVNATIVVVFRPKVERGS